MPDFTAQLIMHCKRMAPLPFVLSLSKDESRPAPFLAKARLIWHPVQR